MIELLILSLHADPSMPPGIGTYGGGHMYPKELLIGLSSHDFHVTLLTRKSYTTLPDKELINKNCTIYRLDYGSYGVFDKRELYGLREKSYRLAMEVIKNEHITFQIIHSIYWNSGQLAMQLSELYHIPFVHSTISNGKQILMRQAKEIEPHRIRVESEVFQKAHCLFCITRSEKEAITNLYNIPDDKIKVIGRPVDHSYQFPIHNDLGYTRNMNWEDDQYLLPIYEKRENPSSGILWWKKQAFTYVGRIDRNKGLGVILKAWQSLYVKYETLCPPLWIVGGTPDEINDFHAALNIDLTEAEKTGKLIWWGTLDAKGISAIYLRTITTIMHSNYEPGGRVSLEAMTAGVPVIATKCGFAGDMIEDWSNGFLVDYGDTVMLTKRMEHFIQQPFLSYALGHQARNSAHKVSDDWDFLGSHIRVYNELSGEITESDIRFEEDYVSARDYINVYPFCNFRAEKPAIERFLGAYFNTPDIKFHPMAAKANCFRWKVLTQEREYVLFQPFSHINRFVFYQDGDRYDEVFRASSRFKIHMHWASRISSNTLSSDAANHLVLCTSSPFLDYDRDLPDIIDYIQTNRSTGSHDGSDLAAQIGLMLKKNVPTVQIREYYEAYMDNLVLFPQGNFSCCLESRKLLDIIRQNTFLTKLLGERISAFLAETEQMDESRTPYVVSGFMSEFPSFLRREDTVALADCEYLHLAHPGEDYAKLLIMLSGNTEDTGIWKTNLERFPKNERSHTLLWGIILLAKKILLQNNMAQSIDSLRVPVNQINLLAELWSTSRLP